MNDWKDVFWTIMAIYGLISIVSDVVRLAYYLTTGAL